MRLWPLIPAWLLLAAMITGAALSIAGQGPTIAASPAELTVTLTTDSDNYLKGEIIQISGTVKDSLDQDITSGTVTIQFSYGDWSENSTVQIVNGSYSKNYYILYGNPAGAWTITASAADGLGDTGTASKSVTVTSPDNDVYTVIFTSPDNSVSYSRGRTLTMSSTITYGGSNVENAGSVFVNSPTGENIPLGEKGSGVYENIYTIKFDDPAENWSMSVEGRKTTDSTFRAGGTYINIQVVPATLTVNLQSPTKDKFEVGEEMVVRVEVLYPFDGGPVESATVSVNDPIGGSLALTSEGSGIYSTTYTPQTTGAWTIQVQAVDSYNNSCVKNISSVTITTARAPGFLEQYWWAILSVVLAVAFVSLYKGRGKRLAGKLVDVQREIKEIPRLKKEAAIKYFKDGTISRTAYDGLIKRYDARMDELKKQEAALKPKLKKKVKRKR